KAVAVRAAAALAGAYEQLGKKQEAAAMLAVQLEYLRGPRRGEVQKRLPLLREQLGDHAAAHALLQAIVAIDPSDHDRRGNYIALSRRSGKTVEAARALGRAVATSKEPATRARVGADLGRILLEVGDARRARSVLNDVVETRADDAAVLSAARTLSQLHA